MENATDFFISFSHPDKEWADWIAWTLDEIGYSIVYQPWNFVPGTNFVLGMNSAARACKTIAVLSPHYLSSSFTQPEWAAAFAQDPTGQSRRLIPVRIEACDLAGTLLAQIVYIDLTDETEPAAARAKLLAGLQGEAIPRRPDFQPHYSYRAPPFPRSSIPLTTRASRNSSPVRNLPPPGLRVPLSARYMPPAFRGIQIDPDNPLILDFILDSGDAMLRAKDLVATSVRLTEYFLATLSVSDENLWVNLSPYESDRIIPDDLGRTRMGADLLEQDYVLKQLISSLYYPERSLGKNYWKTVHESGGRESEATKTYTKVWIVPRLARIIERGAFAILDECLLRVLIEEDYLALIRNAGAGGVNGDRSTTSRKPLDDTKFKFFRSLLLPHLESEVNLGGNFAVLRQIYTSLILANWYKAVLGRSVAEKLRGSETRAGVANEPSIDEIYRQYVQSYKFGVFNYVREDPSQSSEEIPRKYFSGGFSAASILGTTDRLKSESLCLRSNALNGVGTLYWVRVSFEAADTAPDGVHTRKGGNPGGIDLSTRAGFGFEIDRLGRGVEFRISDEVLDRLKRVEVGHLRPRISIIRRIDTDSLEISATTDLRQLLCELDPD